MQSQVGTDSVVAGRYTLERCINTGGIGSLWLVRDEQTGRTCAMRLADGTGHNIFELAARYRSEADIIERIRCENVLDIIDYGDWNEMPYLVLEHLDGEDLATRLRREGHLSAELTYRLLAQTARALARAHAVGIVHGDVTPENILIAADGMQSVAKVYNFSLTQRASESSAGTVTKIGSYLRLPHYASPEQAAGKGLDWRSDLWSLGVLGYECLTGRKPFESNVFGDLVAQILCEPVPEIKLPNADTPPALQAWWEKACTRDPENRFQSAKQMSDALGQAFDLPIVFVPEAAFGAGAVATTPAPAAGSDTIDESRVGIRTKSKPKMLCFTTQIGLGAANSKISDPTPIPAPVVEEVKVEVPAPVVEEVQVEVPAPESESIDLPEDVFAGFQVSEAPTLSLRQAEHFAQEEEEADPDRAARQLKRTKSLRRTVSWILAILVVIVAIPLVRMALEAQHKKIRAAAPAVSMSSAIAKASAKDIAPTGSNASTTSAPEAASTAEAARAVNTETLPNVETPSSVTMQNAGNPIALAAPNPQIIAGKHAAGKSGLNSKKSAARASGKAAKAPTSTTTHEKTASEATPEVASKPAKPKSQPATHDYGI